MKSKLSFALKVAAHSFLFLLIWAVWSVPELLTGDHEGFQASGAIIICWGIFSIGRERIKYEKWVLLAENTVVLTAINRLEAHRKVTEEKLELTFNLHMLSISRLNQKVGLSKKIGPSSPSEIDALALELEAELQDKPRYFKIKEDDAYLEAIENLKVSQNQLAPWSRLQFNTELTFIIVGTLQSAYGAQFSKTLAETGVIGQVTGLFL